MWKLFSCGLRASYSKAARVARYFAFADIIPYRSTGFSRAPHNLRQSWENQRFSQLALLAAESGKGKCWKWDTYFRTSPFLIPCFAFTNIIPCPSKIWNTFFANFHFFPHKTGACFANHPQNTLLTVIYPLFYSFTVCFSILIPISLPLPPQVVRPHTVLSVW